MEGLLSDEGDDEEVMDAVVAADFVPPLAKYMNHDFVDKIFGAQVLSQLIWVFDDRTPEESVTLAISTLDDYCNKSAENVEDTFNQRMYLIVDYLVHPLARVRKLGLSLASSFAKQTVDHRRTLANLTGLRDAVEDCCNSDDPEISSMAKDILEKIKTRRVGAGAAARNLRASRPS